MKNPNDQTEKKKNRNKWNQTKLGIVGAINRSTFPKRIILQGKFLKWKTKRQENVYRLLLNVCVYIYTQLVV